jgi:hypothetical protein
VIAARFPPQLAAVAPSSGKYSTSGSPYSERFIEGPFANAQSLCFVHDVVISGFVAFEVRSVAG